MRLRLRTTLLLSLPFFFASTLALADATPSTERVSVNTAGAEGNNGSNEPSISGDGRFVAFYSFASNLVAGDSNGTSDVFVHDRQTGTTSRVSVNTAVAEGNSASYTPSISGDGRFVAFYSTASNLVAGDSNGTIDVFVHDRQTGTTSRVSVNTAGTEGNSDSYGPSISGDGRFVAFNSSASNLVAGDSNGYRDVFVHDRQTGTTSQVSVNTAGAEGNSESYAPSISVDGRFVAFNSSASNLVAGDSNGTYDVFVHDRQTGTTSRVSVNTAGTEGNSDSYETSISGDGRFVAFNSSASNLVAGDSNGYSDVFVHDRQTGTTSRVSVNTAGAEGNSYSNEPSISGDGRFVAFYSYAGNLVAGDSNGTRDVFVHDRQTGTTSRVSVNTAGAEGNDDGYDPSISGDGRFVAFFSSASNLVAGDSNGTSDVFVRGPLTSSFPWTMFLPAITGKRP